MTKIDFIIHIIFLIFTVCVAVTGFMSIFLSNKPWWKKAIIFLLINVLVKMLSE